MEFKKLVQLIEACEYEVRSYSGRGMYGKNCLGITCGDPQNISLEIIEEFLKGWRTSERDDVSEVQELCDMLKNARTDSMGMDMIIYWPGIKWEEDFEEDEDDYEDRPFEESCE